MEWDQSICKIAEKNWEEKKLKAQLFIFQTLHLGNLSWELLNGGYRDKCLIHSFS